MRIPTWFLTAWVILAVGLGIVGSYLSYTQSRERTRELNDIASLEDGVDVVRIVGLLGGWEEPELPDTSEQQDNQFAPDIDQPTVVIPTATTATPIVDNTVDQTSEPAATTPTPAPTELVVAEDATQAPDVGNQRINVLVMGIDQREGETGPFPTDTMMVLSLNPVTKSGVILSIPRDIYVNFPLGLGRGRINTANIIGETQQYPGGGPEYAKRTVSEFLGIPIHYYVMVNFTAFLEVMEVVGPVNICITEPIDDDKYPDGSYGVRPIHFDAGCQDLSPDRLLEYSRTRATTNGDIDRAARQQQVILAVRDKIVNVSGVTNLIANVDSLWQSVSANIRTDLSFEDIISLGLFMEEVPSENIVNATIGYDRVTIETLPTGDQVLVPIRNDIYALVAELFRR